MRQVDPGRDQSRSRWLRQPEISKQYEELRRIAKSDQRSYSIYKEEEKKLTERASPPPAESPERMILDGWIGACPDPEGGSMRKR